MLRQFKRSPLSILQAFRWAFSRFASGDSRRLAVAIVAAWLSVTSVVQAGSYYWFGDDNNFWNQIVGPGGTNWSSSGDFNNGTGGATALPGSGDDVFFVLAGANNLTTEHRHELFDQEPYVHAGCNKSRAHQ